MIRPVFLLDAFPAIVGVIFLIAYEFFLVDLRKIYFLLEFIFVGKSVQTNLGENLFPQKVCKTFFFFCEINLHCASCLQTHENFSNK